MPHAGDSALKQKALSIINDNFKLGWDTSHGGGLLYFVDVLGYSTSEWGWEKPSSEYLTRRRSSGNNFIAEESSHHLHASLALPLALAHTADCSSA